MSKEQATEKAFDYTKSGFHCAEAVSKTIVELYGDEADGSEVQRFAAGFMGGIGATGEDVCGALSGGIVAIGCLRGKREAGQDNEEVKGLAAEFRSRFVREFGSSRCSDILEALRGREDGFDCSKLTAAAAGLLSELLMERGISG
jgi:C_GCAxxG_C_C family probable redox protein